MKDGNMQMLKFGKKVPFLKWGMWLAGFGLLCGLLVVSVIVFEVYFGDDSKLKRTTILARINQETSIFCHDEKSLLGSFFNNARRNYVSIDNIPAHMLNAMIAAEDKNFYEHIGIDPAAIASAFMEGVLNGGRFRRGGSTITQQTVKNILDSWEHSFRRKFKESIAAIQLERLYDKRQILEFYLNQFHVAGNGKGVGIAARYYFNKNVNDLNLVEAAFIAGSVKGPSKYNPFIKFTGEERDKARQNAFERKNYVLGRMFEQGWISQEEMQEAAEQQVPFNRGKFRIQEVSLVNMIRKDINRDEILEALGVENIDELANAGLKIYSTIDCDLQADAQLKMRQNLSRLELILKGFKVEDPKAYKRQRYIEVGKFYHTKIKKIHLGEEPYIETDLGYPQGIIPYEALKRLAMLLDLPSGKGFEHHLKQILAELKEGDILYAEVIEYNKEDNLAVLEMRKHPVISGGLIALDKGEVRSVITGFDTQGFNRALMAKRQPGSVFKTVVYYAALQLGWSILDRLENHRQVFTYQDQFYYPRAEHASAYPDVSIVWAGVLSENLASVYLAAHLLDKLNFEQFRQLLDYMGLAPRRGESASKYKYRVARAVGVQTNDEGIERYQFNKAKQSIAANLMFDGMTNAADEMGKMWWGVGHEAELQKIYKNEEDRSLREMHRRVVLMKNNYQRMQKIVEFLEADWQKLGENLSQMSPSAAFRNSAYASILKNFRVLTGQSAKPVLGYFPSFEEEEPIEEEEEEKSAEEVASAEEEEKEPVTEYKPAALPGRPLNALDLRAIWGRSGFLGMSTNVDVDEVILDGYFSLRDYKKLTDEFSKYKTQMAQNEDKYSLNRMFNHHDFRIGLALKYLTFLTKAMGVESKLEPILSFPLGTNDVSLAEIAKIYQTFTNGEIYRFYKKGPSNQITFLKRIEDSDGNVVYEVKPKSFKMVSEHVTMQTREILRRIVTHGTGRRARSELYVSLGGDEDEAANKKRKVKKRNVRVPSFGKTGTTNDFTTASFAGFIPYPVEKGAPLDPANSYAVATYVGYDFNETMRNGRLKIYGGTGALPLWIDYGRMMIEKHKFKDYLDPYDLDMMAKNEWQLKFPRDLENVLVDLPRGGIVSTSGQYDDEDYATTNTSVDGETYVNEFALTAGVKANLYLPMKRSGFFGNREPVRSVEFFNDPFQSFMQDYEESRLQNARIYGEPEPKSETVNADKG